MAQEQDSVTPEEKLLNVIQSGGEEQAAPEEKLAEAVSAPAEVPPPAAEESAPAEAKPALKLAPKEEEAKPEAAAEGEAAAEEAPAAEPIGAAAPAAAMISSKKKAGVHSGVKVINRMLAAGILILLGLSGFETFRVIKVRGAVKKPASLQLPDAAELTITATDVQRAYAINPWWIDPGTIIRQPTGPVGPRAPSTPWSEDMKSFKLMGVSMRDPKADSEAILVDTRDNRMYFVRLGDSISVSGVDVKLDDLEAQRARFTDGRASIELK